MSLVSRILAGLLVFTLAGCVGLPQEGPIRSGTSRGSAERAEAPFDFTPDGPRAGATPLDIVGGFLQAMQATPVSTVVAREFLTDEASSRWVPEKSTVVYGVQSLETGRRREVRMSLTDTVRLGPRGEWLGDTTSGRGVRRDLRLVREGGQWRITNPPDALILPQAHFDTRFAQQFLYFFDQTAQILVPEPVYLPRGEQAPTLLVRGLLRGPDQNLPGVTKTFIPARTELDDLSVLMAGDGTAQVPLSGEILDLDEESLDLALGQLAWTLRQIQGVETMRVTVDGSPLEVPGQGIDLDVHGWAELDPSVSWASEELFGLRDGRVVTSVGTNERRIGGPFGTGHFDLRSIAVDLPAAQVAGVDEGGTRVLVASRAPEGEDASAQSRAQIVYAGGTDLLRPAWDIYAQTWLVDRRAGGATVSVVRDHTVTELDAKGITGRNVKAFLVSRDGTRLVAVVAGERRDRLVVARILRGENGAVRRLSTVTRLAVGTVVMDDIRDLAWRTPTSLALLTGPTPGVSQVVIALIDGSSPLDEVTTAAEALRNTAVRIVTSPAPGAPVYVATKAWRLYELAPDGRWAGTNVKPGLRQPTFVG